MITIMEKKVAYYLRTSHYLQNISTQVDKIEDGWKIYKDEGVSGRIEFSSRPSGRRLLQDLKKNRISQVKVLRIDRLGRNVQDILDTINTIHSFGVPINSLSEGITTLDDKGNVTPTTGLLVNVLSSLSEFFYHQNREKMLTGIQLTRQKNPEKYKGRLHGSNEDIDKYMNKPKTIKIY